MCVQDLNRWRSRNPCPSYGAFDEHFPLSDATLSPHKQKGKMVLRMVAMFLDEIVMQASMAPFGWSGSCKNSVGIPTERCTWSPPPIADLSLLREMQSFGLFRACLSGVMD